jgi:hypothetical protein
MRAKRWVWARYVHLKHTPAGQLTTREIEATTLILLIYWQSVVNLPKRFENLLSVVRGKDFPGATLTFADCLNVLNDCYLRE